MLNRGSSLGGVLGTLWVLVSLLEVAIPPAQAQNAAPAAAPVKLGIVSFLTGPAAAPFGIPGRNGAEIMIEAMNAGKVPAPFNKVGFGGSNIEAKYIDEAGSAANVVTEFRNLVQRDQVDAVVGYVSSGSCLAVTPVAEELKALTVFYDCGTPRIFEEKSRAYVFRVSPHATMDSVAAARYLLAKKQDVTSYSGINQNYAWGQDSWRDFAGAMQVLAPKVTADKALFPKLFAGEYGAEISTLLTSKSQILHTSFYDGDLEAFVYQEQARALDKRMTILATTGEAAMWRLRDKMPNGTMIGGRGPHGPLAPDSDLNRWFQKIYTDRYSIPPTYPAYQMAMSLLGLKLAYEKARKGDAKPTTDEVAAAFKGIEFDGPSGKVKLAIGDGHQGISETAYGTYRFNKEKNEPEIVDIIRFPAECVNPPAGINADDWIKDGMKGAKC
ncbi:MAG TPA: ABC transporter substrate-binding protein [Steroidobacteraceae bacterium]|jgi:branched-chain amino acid transport system substrate-binding protein|uniref:ABC transporter substrate-binding protein n=1 Tax=Bradyrhizobium sp. TaxID=376 RepID=UPI002CEBD852|nr:ABC transporter substrate-binding protein [Bradyrhizobium sp.]HWX26198.1 ABC transporter substrate-binding protein [Steroidobacteraceae bacterium]HXB77024.1 ABC transporter substrate-binding protein [Bradyrhizobium sp.]